MSKINTDNRALNSLYHLNRNIQGMDQAMERIASGKRINRGGDDAAGAAIVNHMTSQIKGLEVAIRNSADAISLAQTAEGALIEVSSVLQRIRELSVQSANGTYDGADRQALNAEVVQLQKELQRIAETTYFNDTRLLNGNFQDTNFQIGHMDGHVHTLTIEDVRPGALGEYTLKTSQEAIIDDGSADGNGNGVGADPSAATPTAGATTAANATSRVTANEDLTIYGHVGSTVIDIKAGNTAKEIAELVNAKESQTGVRATAETRVKISFVKPTNALTDTMSFSLYGMDGVAADVTATINFGGTASGGTAADLTNLRNAINSKTGTTGVTASIADDKESLTLTSVDGYDIVVENFDVATIVATDTTAVNPMLRMVGIDEDGTEVGTAVNLHDGSHDADAADSSRITGQVTFHAPEIFSVHTAADGTAGGGLFQAAPGAANLDSMSSMDILTVDNAKKMMSIVDGALRRIDAERGDLGATMNRMQYTINNISNIIMNTKAARSRIEDSDIAVETANLTKAQVLQQAAQAMLAQANQTAQSVLSLLQ